MAGDNLQLPPEQGVVGEKRDRVNSERLLSWDLFKKQNCCFAIGCRREEKNKTGKLVFR